MAGSQGCEVTIEPKEDGIYLALRKAEFGPAEEEHVPATDIVLFIASGILGRGDNQQLGDLLMQSFLHTVGGLKSKPQTIIFMNSGVKLVTKD